MGLSCCCTPEFEFRKVEPTALAGRPLQPLNRLFGRSGWVGDGGEGLGRLKEGRTLPSIV